MRIPTAALSPSQQSVLKDTKSRRKPQGTKKLCATLTDKSFYVVHSALAKLYEELGLEMTKIHSVLRFNQSAWMEPYVAKNTEFRKKAGSKFEETFFKAKVNSCFGKTIETPKPGWK